MQMRFYQADSVDGVIHYVQHHLDQIKKCIDQGGSTTSVIPLINHTHRYIEKIKRSELDQFQQLAEQYMESQNFHQKFELERLEQEKAFVKEMFENYAKMYGVQEETLKILIEDPAAKLSVVKKRAKRKPKEQKDEQA